MLFNSLHYVIFFPAVLAVYLLLPYRFRWMFLLPASYYFYMCWNPKYAILMAVTTLIDYWAAIQIASAKRPAARKAYLLVSLCTGFGVLFAFKYLNFFSSSLASFLSFYGLDIPAGQLNVLLPVAISFYTFQSISYVIDVYRGAIKPERHLGIFALYISFFPQLVAGPIERAGNILPQFHRRPAVDLDRMWSGLLLVLAGYFKKLVIADRLAPYVSAVYDNPDAHVGLPFLLAIYFFTFQLYADFSGYADIAIGSAQILGYRLMDNFHRPFYSKSIAEFWRRWHISLTSWMRDYLYIALGGNRVAPLRRHLNVFLVFLFAGLWHGANWTYVIWGGLHGVYIIVGAVTQRFRDRITGVLFAGRRASLHRLVQVAVTFHLFAISLVIFRAHSIVDVWVLVSGSLSHFEFDLSRLFGPLPASELIVAGLAIAVLEAVELVQRKGPIRERLFGKPLPVRWAAYLLLVFGVLVFGTFTSREFIYFQF